VGMSMFLFLYNPCLYRLFCKPKTWNWD